MILSASLLQCCWQSSAGMITSREAGGALFWTIMVPVTPCSALAPRTIKVRLSLKPFSTWKRACASYLGLRECQRAQTRRIRHLRGEAAHLNGDQRLLETTVCECTSRLMSAMLEKCNSGRGREEGERGGPREIPQCWMQKGCVDECTNETTTVTVDSVLLAVY